MSAGNLDTRNDRKNDINQKIFETLLSEAVDQSFDEWVEQWPKEEDLADFPVSEELRHSLEQSMAKEAKTKKKKRLLRHTKRLAACIILVFVVSFGSLMTVDAYREALVNAVFHWGQDTVNIILGGIPEENPYEPTYLPEGYVEESKNQIPDFLHIKYKNAKGDRIVFASFVKSEDMTATLSIDTTDMDCYEMEYNGIPFRVFESKVENSCSYLFWDTEEYLFRVYGKTSVRELCKMMESVKLSME